MPGAADRHYVGRFAPSPTGALHFGSLVTALAGYLRARSADGAWLLRIDDIDVPRNTPGAAAGILLTLQQFGLSWDAAVQYQRGRINAYRAACAQLLAQGHAYYCTCSRRHVGHGAYPGTCRGQMVRPAARHCVRVRVGSAPIVIEDVLQARSIWNLATAGDFVIWRVEDLPAYHLAAVLDDAVVGVTEVVRGADLLDSAPRQRYLQLLLGLATPAYLHLPTAVDAQGHKLSKQNHAAPIDGLPVREVLCAALAWLGHAVPPAMDNASPREILTWAVGAWSLARVPRGLCLAAPVLTS